MNKKQIRLTESDLKQIVKESVNKILSEAYGTPSKWDKETFGSLDTPSYEDWSPSQSTNRRDYYNGNRPFEGVMKIGKALLDLGNAIEDVIWSDEEYIKDAGIETKRRYKFERGENTLYKYQDALRKKHEEMEKIYRLLLNKLKQTTGIQHQDYKTNQKPYIHPSHIQAQEFFAGA